MGVRLDRHLGTAHTLDARQWTTETASGRPAVCCPSCGGISELEQPVLIGGVVSSIWKCPADSCGYREFLTLGSFGEEVLR